MDELCNFVFSSLRESRSDIRNIERHLTRQRLLNGGNVIFSVAAVGWITFLGLEIYQIGKKIDALTKEIEELKNKEGE